MNSRSLATGVRLMPAKDVKAYVKRNKNDTADAEAICEAVRRPTMRFVQIKSAEQQGRLMLHRTREFLDAPAGARSSTAGRRMCRLGIAGLRKEHGRDQRVLRRHAAEDADGQLPVKSGHHGLGRAGGGASGDADAGSESIEKRIMAQHRGNEASQRLESIPGIGVIGATAIAATVPDPKVFFDRVVTSRPGSKSCRAKIRLAASRSSGRSRNRAIAICDAFWWSEPVRCCGTHAIGGPEKYPWLTQLLARKPFKVVAVALANKMARTAWALLAKGGTYRAPALAAAA